ncbi:MAG: hypothetical protein QM569_10425 [Acidovorax sp.]|uniref:hypothetical protein n=1 Tax=Acidovorax sp. TaxID=1872122 RepID=UPI0039E3ADC5
MRRGLYFVLMVVLVLRGLAGSAMAAGVLPAVDAPHHGHHTAAAAQHDSHHGGGADCAAHDGQAASACSACGICHSAMLDAPTVLAQAAAITASALPDACARFESAPPAPAIKPPIS